ncbi:unnamed protein product [Camellia sinensis]
MSRSSVPHVSTIQQEASSKFTELGADHPSEWSSELYPLGVSCGVVVVELRGPPPPSLLLLLTSSPAFAAVDSADLAIMPRILSLICPRRLGGMVNFGWVLGLISISENWL